MSPGGLAALTTIEGLSAWWATDTSGDPAVGGTIAFRFAPGGFDMQVRESRPVEHVLRCDFDRPMAGNW